MTNYKDLMLNLKLTKDLIRDVEDKLDRAYTKKDEEYEIVDMLIVEIIKTRRHLAQLLYLLEKSAMKDIVERGLKDE